MASAAAPLTVLTITDEAVLSLSVVLDVVKENGKEGLGQCDPRIITQASSLSQLPVDSSSMDIVYAICKSPEFPGDMLFGEISRVLKPGGAVFVYNTSKADSGESEKAISTLQRRLLLAGFLEAQSCEIVPSKENFSYGVKGKKPSWKIGSSFSIKKPAKTVLKIQFDDDSDLIDEDTLLTEEDLKKPQLPVADDCEVGSTRKACKNCTCGRAEIEEKAVKLGPTMDQLDNPQSACGNCGLGDAFRCSTCPYKGLPTFKLGEKVSLSQNFLAADI